MDRKTETQLRQEIAEVFDSRCNYGSFAGRVCNKCGRIHDGGKSVAVVGEPIYWIDPDDDANLSRISRVGWSPLYGESPASIPAAELARLRENAAEADELRKHAERYRWLRENWFTMTSVYGSNGTIKFQINQTRYSNATEATIDAAIAQEGE